MAALGAELVTLADVAKSKDKKIGKVAEVLVQHNEMLNDIPSMEMNEGTIHKEDIRSALPAVYYRKANQPIPASKSTIEERTFTATHFESKSQIDRAVAERGGMDRVAYNRWNQAQGHLQAHAQELATLMLYGSPSNSNLKTAGFFDIFSTLASTEATSKQIVDALGKGSDNTSILKVHWGEHSVFGVYPKGTNYGITREDYSQGGKYVKIPGLDVNGNAGDFWGYEEDFLTDHGLVVKDYRQCARIANIDVSDLKDLTGADLIDLMISANYKIDTLSNGKGVWYMNRTLEAFLHKQALTKVGAGAGLSFDNFEGKRILTFLGDPIRRMDALLNSEDRVIA
jgi:hypothetical protein